MIRVLATILEIPVATVRGRILTPDCKASTLLLLRTRWEPGKVSCYQEVGKKRMEVVTQ